MNLVHAVASKLGLMRAYNDVKKLRLLMLENFINAQLSQNPRYLEPRRLQRYEQQVFSQNGEDGIIHEIFERIGLTNKYFVEVGAADGQENNTTALLLDGWGGFWLEADEKLVTSAQENFKDFLQQKKLFIQQSFVTCENIEKLFRSANVPKEFDFLSIDIDGNDYWIWKRLEGYRPRVLALEYNGSFGSFIEWVRPYNPNSVWDNSSFGGASLKSFQILGDKMGYKLVGCNFSGVNCFFVREDVIGGKFLPPYTSENHFETPRGDLLYKVGYKRDYRVFKAAARKEEK